MKRRIGFLEQNTSIFTIDFNGLKDKALVDCAVHANVEVKNISEEISFYIDVSEAKITFEVFQYILDASKEVQPYIRKSAVLGVKGFNRFLFKQYCRLTGSKARSFDCKQEALTYLNNVN